MDNIPALPAREVNSEPVPTILPSTATKAPKTLPNKQAINLASSDERFRLELHTAETLLPNRPLVEEIVYMINESYAAHLKVGIMTEQRIPGVQDFDEELLEDHVLLLVVYSITANEVLATAGYKSLPNHKCELTLYAAKSSMKGTGLGSYTLAVLEQVAKDRGFDRVTAWAIRAHGLVDFYERRDYSIVTEETVPLEKVMVKSMAKRLKEFQIAVMEKALV